MQHAGGSTLDLLDQPVNPELWVARNQQKHMIRHRFQFDDRCVPFGADLADDLLETRLDKPAEDPPALFRAPHNVVGAAVDDVVVRPEFVLRTPYCVVLHNVSRA
jgi:hypothetical protein